MNLVAALKIMSISSLTKNMTILINQDKSVAKDSLDDSPCACSKSVTACSSGVYNRGAPGSWGCMRVCTYIEHLTKRRLSTRLPRWV